MIQLNRPQNIEILETKGKIETEKLKSDFDNGITDFEFDNKILSYSVILRCC